MCATRDSNMLWLVILEVCLLLAVLVKLSWDCVRYRRTGHLPWIARHMCWSVPGISRSRWSPRLPNIFSRNDSSTEENARRIVSKAEMQKGNLGQFIIIWRNKHQTVCTVHLFLTILNFSRIVKQPITTDK